MFFTESPKGPRRVTITLGRVLTRLPIEAENLRTIVAGNPNPPAPTEIVFETWCRPRARPPLSLCISSLHFLRFPRDQDNLYLPRSSFLFWDLKPLWCRPYQIKPAQLTHTRLPAAGATAVHQTGVRYTLCSFYGSCWCLAFTHTSAQQRALYLTADMGFLHKPQTQSACVRHHWHTHFVHDLTVEPRPTTTHLLHHNLLVIYPAAYTLGRCGTYSRSMTTPSSQPLVVDK